MNTTTIVAVIALLVIIGGGLYYNTMTPMGVQMVEKGDAMIEEGGKMIEKGDDMMGEGEAMKKEGEAMMEMAPVGAMSSAGSYEAYSPDKLARASDGDVVLFFRASWCPTCRAVDADIRAHLNDIPKGVTILDINYDDSTALKQKYGVTYQHTFVQVDAAGNQIVKWSGSPTLASLLGNIK
jgi:thiol-disulfide isomerase/thioredoxin